jgi:hypothetical protein
MFETPSDETLEKVSSEFDNFFYEMCRDSGLDPLELSASFLARMSRVAIEAGYVNEFKRLMDMVAKNITKFELMSGGDESSVH